MCSSKVGGTPTGTVISAGATVDACMAICSRRSISRMSAAYSSMRRLSDALNLTRSRDRLSPSESRMLRSRCRRAARCSAVLPSPNNRSNTTCGFSSIGSGWLALTHEIELV